MGGAISGCLSPITSLIPDILCVLIDSVSVVLDLYFFVCMILWLPAVWQSGVLIATFLVAIFLLCGEDPPNIGTYLPTSSPFKALSRRRRLFMRSMRKAYWTLKWYAKYEVPYIMKRKYGKCRRLYLPLFKHCCHVVKRAYGRVRRLVGYHQRRLVRLVVQASRRAFKFIRSASRLEWRTRPSRNSKRSRSSTKGRPWRKFRRRRLAYHSVMKCRRRAHANLPGSALWRRSLKRKQVRMKNRERNRRHKWSRTKRRGKMGCWTSNPGLPDQFYLDIIDPHFLDYFISTTDVLGEAKALIDLHLAVEELSSPDADVGCDEFVVDSGSSIAWFDEAIQVFDAGTWKRSGPPARYQFSTPQRDRDIDLVCNSTNVLIVPRMLKHQSMEHHRRQAAQVVSRYNIAMQNVEGGTYQCTHSASGSAYEDTPLIFDTGASSGLTPFRADFITYHPCNIEIKDISKTNTVIGMGLAMYKIKASNGDELFVPFPTYHLESADIRLMSPQSYHQAYGGSTYLDGDRAIMHLVPPPGTRYPHDIEIPIDKKGSNLPMLYNVSCTKDEHDQIGPSFKSMMMMDEKYFGMSSTYNVSLEGDDYHFYDGQHLFAPCVSDCENKNLSTAQKELLFWHWKLGHISMKRIQRLMKDQVANDGSGDIVMCKVITPKNPGAANCKIPKCETCQLSSATKRNPQVKTSKAVQEKEKILSSGALDVGDLVSMDQFVSHTPGRLESGFGRTSADNCYHGGTIFHEAASGAIFVRNQVSLGASDTINAKIQFEEWLWHQSFCEVQHYHSDNGVFVSEDFVQDCKSKYQDQTFSGVAAQHQNANAERSIKTIMWMARAMLLHVSLRWSNDGVDNISLWPFAVRHAVWLHNRLPNQRTGITPLELLRKEKDDHRDLLRSKTFGCPVYVLDPSLANDKKIPKWNRRARMGQFLGLSEHHSSLVPLVRHLKTGHVSPQYHIVSDDLFETVFGDRETDEAVDLICQGLFENNRDLFAEPEYDADGELVYEPPPLETVWLDEEDFRERKERLIAQRRRRQLREQLREERSRDLLQKIPAPAPTSSSTLPPTGNTNRSPSTSSPTTVIPADDDTAPQASTPTFEAEGDVWADHRDVVVDELDQLDQESEHPSFHDTNQDSSAAVQDDPSSAPEGDSDSSIEGSIDSDDAVRAPTGRRRVRFDGTRPRNGSGTRRSNRNRTANNPAMRGLDNHPEFNNVADMSTAERASLSSSQRAKYAVSLHPNIPPARAMSAKRRRKMRKYKQQIGDLRIASDSSLAAMSFDHNSNRLNNRNLDEDEDDAVVEEIASVEELMASPLSRFIHLAANDCGYSGSVQELICTFVHPLFLKAKSEASKHDNPNWKTAMSGEHADKFWEACKVELNTLENMGAWEVVKRTAEMKVIKSTWAFKIKRYPDGLIKKFKARFCARGDMQVEGRDFFETYAPVVQWTTVRLMLILEVLLDLKSKQGDVTAAFLHAHLDEDEKVYVEMPLGFKQPGKVLSLRRTLYGLRQSPRAFWKYLVLKMEEVGMKQSDLDPCLFIGERCIAISYVDDILFWATSDQDINNVATALRGVGVDLEQEEDAAGFLGVRIERNEQNLIELKQEGLIDRVCEALGLDSNATNKWTPAESTPLVRDENGEAFSEEFNYSSVIGMLLYLSGHSRPDIAYAVNCAARYMFSPRAIHEKAVKRIGRYLKATRSRGLVLNPSSNPLEIDAYPDADFAGMWGHENVLDPSSVKSRTGFVINVANCPVLWISKLQSGCTAQSTMEAEIIALNHCCRELFPIVDMVSSLSSAVGLGSPSTTMKVSIHEDNSGALILAETLPPQFTPRSKHYAIKTIWFREEIVKRGIKLLKIDTVEQLGDMFTKGLPRATFEYLRKKLMGW